jgi:hypothetical protein
MKTYGGVDVYIHIFLVSAPGPGRFTPGGKSLRYLLERNLGGTQSRSERREENSLPYEDSNSDPSVVQLVTSRYTDYAIPTLYINKIHTLFHQVK